MKNIADHIFDILENSVAAGATEVEIILNFPKRTESWVGVAASKENCRKYGWFFKNI